MIRADLRIYWLSLISLIWTCFYLSPIDNFDLWWHLDSGRWMIDHQKVLLEEVRSAADAGTPWTNFSWAFQVLLAMTHLAFGEWGLLVLKAGLWVGILFIAGLVAVEQRGEGLTAWVIVLLIAGFTLPPYMMLRPHLFAALCLTVAIWLLRYPWHRYTAMSWAVLLLVWANVHASVVVGCVALWLHVFGEAYRNGTDLRTLWRSGLVLLLFSLIPFLTPNGTDLLAVLFSHATGDLAKNYILEWSAEPLSPPLFVVVVLAIMGFVAAWERFSFGELFLFVFFFWFAIDNHRFQFELQLTVVRPATLALAGMLVRGKAAGGSMPVGWVAFLAATAATFYYNHQQLSVAERWRTMPVKVARYPTTGGLLLVDIANAIGRPVRVLNHYEFGGYLSWLGKGVIRPFIDGRTPTVFSDHRLMEEIFAITDREMRREIASRYEMDAMLLRHEAGLAFLPDDPDWWLIGFDGVSQLYIRGNLAQRLGFVRLTTEPTRLIVSGDSETRNQQVRALVKMTRVDPANFLAWVHLGMAYGNSESTRGLAISAFRKAISLRPKHALSHLLLARQLRAMGRGDDEVYAVLDGGLGNADTDLNAGQLQELAALLLELRQPGQALEVLQSKDRDKMYRLDTKYLTWMYRAIAHAAMGDPPRAVFALDLAKRLLPVDDESGAESIASVQALINDPD